MLPLVANIPSDLAQPPFHENFFKNFQEGQSEIESKIDIKCSVVALFECLLYAHQKNLISNALDIVFNVVKKSIVKDSPEGAFAMSEIAKPFFDMMTKYAKNAEQKRSYDKIYSEIFELMGSQSLRYLADPSRANEEVLIRCAAFIRSVCMCARKTSRVKFSPEPEKSKSEETLDDMQNDLGDLFIELIKLREQKNQFYTRYT